MLKDSTPTRVGVLSFSIDTAPQSFLRCSNSAQKSTVGRCQAATVVMETTQLVLSQF